MSRKVSPEFAIVTAMQPEHEAIICMMDQKLEDCKGYSLWLTPPEFGRYEVAVLSHVRKDRTAEQRTGRLLRDFPRIRTVICVGVCGANPCSKYGKGLEIGDVVIPRIIKDKHGDREDFEIESELMEQAQELSDSIGRGKPSLNPELWKTATSRLRVPEFSDEAKELNRLLENPITLKTEGTLGTFGKSKNDKEDRAALAVDFADQEGYGVSYAAQIADRRVLVIRGVSDKMDRLQRLEDGSLTESQDYLNQQYASRTAAAVCGILLGTIGISGFVTKEMITAGRERYDPLGSLSWKGNPYNAPLAIPHQFLKNRLWMEHWPPKAFYIALLDNEILLGNEDGLPRLEVFVPDNPICIFNNAGKRFLYDKFPRERYNDIRRKVDDYFLEAGKKVTRLQLTNTPLRWASAGALAVVTFRRRKWVVLFYRNIPPVGWNIPNGGSQNTEEWFDINKLAKREFIEEMILIKEHLTSETRHCTLVIPHIPSTDPNPLKEAFDFTTRYIGLRKQEGIEVERSSEQTNQHGGVVNVSIRSKAFLLRVNGERKTDFVFSLNTAEHGIEAIKIFELDLDAAGVNYLLDGEVSEDESKLIKSPVVLLSLDYLNRVFPKVRDSSENYDHCKVLPEAAIGRTARNGDDYKDCDYVLFDYDVNSKEESIRSAFAKISREGKIEDEAFMLLCPVTWKTLETCFRHNIIASNMGDNGLA